jgi:glycosyltransferase involved in cell wall biosynthesis
MNEKLLSIVAAFYNEEEAIPAFFREIEAVMRTLDLRVEYVCVNDGSSDGTLALLRRRMAATPNIRVVNLARNFGKEAAISAGLAHARGAAAIVIDADLQDPPSLIPAFVAKWREGYDVVYGVRASRKADSLLKRTTARMFYALFNRLTDVPIPPGAGDFRLMDRRVVDAILALPERNRFMKGLFSWVGFRQTGVEFVREARVAGRTSWSYLRLTDFAIDGLTSFSIAPLRLASLAGVLVSLLGFIYAAFLVARTLIIGADVPGYASVMVVMMFLGGVQLFCLGLIGEYLGRLYIEAKGRPLYIVADVFSESEAPEEETSSLAAE